MAGKTALVVRAEFGGQAAAPRPGGGYRCLRPRDRRAGIDGGGVSEAARHAPACWASRYQGVTVNGKPLPADATHDASASSTELTLTFAGARCSPVAGGCRQLEQQPKLLQWHLQRTCLGLRAAETAQPNIPDRLDGVTISPPRGSRRAGSYSSGGRRLSKGREQRLAERGRRLCHPGRRLDESKSATVTASVDGKPLPTLQSFNCRGLHRHDCFSGST